VFCATDQDNIILDWLELGKLRKPKTFSDGKLLANFFAMHFDKIPVRLYGPQSTPSNLIVDDLYIVAGAYDVNHPERHDCLDSGRLSSKFVEIRVVTQPSGF